MSASAEKYDVKAGAEVCGPAETVKRGHVNAALRISAATEGLESVHIRRT
jgi:hypothetical protein